MLADDLDGFANEGGGLVGAGGGGGEGDGRVLAVGAGDDDGLLLSVVGLQGAFAGDGFAATGLGAEAEGEEGEDSEDVFHGVFFVWWNGPKREYSSPH